MEVTGPQRFGIGALSKRTGSKVETIRFYERIGLLPRPGGRPAATGAMSTPT